MSERSSKNSEKVLSARNICKSYGSGASYISILKGAGLDVRSGEVVSVVGPSGSGKSTLLHICGVLDAPDEGTVEIGGIDVWSVSEKRRALIRNRDLGFVFQFHHLLEEFTILENVAMPSLLAGSSRKQALRSSEELLKAVGLFERLHHFPSQASGGERQRAAVARALILSPSVVLADEPTGNLDAANSAVVENMIMELAEKRGQAFVIATHSMELADRAHRKLLLKEGKLR